VRRGGGGPRKVSRQDILFSMQKQGKLGVWGNSPGRGRKCGGGSPGRMNRPCKWSNWTKRRRLTRRSAGKRIGKTGRALRGFWRRIRQGQAADAKQEGKQKNDRKGRGGKKCHGKTRKTGATGKKKKKKTKRVFRKGGSNGYTRKLVRPGKNSQIGRGKRGRNWSSLRE